MTWKFVFKCQNFRNIIYCFWVLWVVVIFSIFFFHFGIFSDSLMHGKLLQVPIENHFFQHTYYDLVYSFPMNVPFNDYIIPLLRSSNEATIQLKHWSMSTIVGLYGKLLKAAYKTKASGISDEDDDLFSLKHVVKEPYDTLFNSTFSNIINDYSSIQNCSFDSLKKSKITIHRTLFQFWAKLAEEIQIPYMISCGSLLGYARNKDVIPFDTDVDVQLPSWTYYKLLPYASSFPINLMEKDTFTLYLHPEFLYLPIKKRHQFNCAGEMSVRRTDLCVFDCLMGRLFYNGSYMDLYSTDYIKDHQKLIWRVDDVYIMSGSSYFPLRPCTFAGVKTFCPNRYQEILLNLYSPRNLKTFENLIPVRGCYNGSPIDGSQSLFFSNHLMNEWKKKWYIKDREPVPLEVRDKIITLDYHRLCKLNYLSNTEAYTDCR